MYVQVATVSSARCISEHARGFSTCKVLMKGSALLGASRGAVGQVEIGNADRLGALRFVTLVPVWIRVPTQNKIKPLPAFWALLQFCVTMYTSDERERRMRQHSIFLGVKEILVFANNIWLKTVSRFFVVQCKLCDAFFFRKLSGLNVAFSQTHSSQIVFGTKLDMRLQVKARETCTL